MQHQLPSSQRDEIVKIVQEYQEAGRTPTRWMVAHDLRQRTRITRKTALEYVNMALRDGHIIKRGMNLRMPG